jgi:hypothetical protein
MLIYLNQNSSNNVILTLNENSLLFNYSSITPYYLFHFSSVTTNEQIYFTATNLAPLSAQNSYDKFNIICTGASSGMFWHYNIYEQTQRYNFNIANTVSKVESGKVQYIPATQDFTYISASITGTTNYIAFNTYN